MLRPLALKDAFWESSKSELPQLTVTDSCRALQLRQWKGEAIVDSEQLTATASPVYGMAGSGQNL